MTRAPRPATRGLVTIVNTFAVLSDYHSVNAMRLYRKLRRPRDPIFLSILVALCLAAAVSCCLWSQSGSVTASQIQSSAEAPARPLYRLDPERIYSDDPRDSWNRLFAILFSRRFQARMSSEFPEAGPFQARDDRPELEISERTFERVEHGDRAIDPLYCPAYHTREGRRQLVLDPTYSELMSALQDALDDPAQRTPMARAWMQSDLWSAFDILSEPLFPEDQSPQLETRHKNALDAMARLIRKIALTPEEIQSLPNNYTESAARLGLPDLFHHTNGWTEIEWFPYRAHDGEAEFRRYSRVFVKVSPSVKNVPKMLDDLRKSEGHATESLDGVAILMQLILIDSHGKLTPTQLTSEAELRLFEKGPAGEFQRASIRMAEISRREILREPTSGGMVGEDENAPAYAGGYTFAAPDMSNKQGGEDGPPIVVKLRTRCQRCHGEDATALMSFEMKLAPREPTPHVKQLNSQHFEIAEFDIARKQAWFNRSLRPYFTP